MYEVVLQICTEGWDRAVTSHLATALDDAAWALVRERTRRICRLLAEAATQIEAATSALGDAAGLAAREALRRAGLPQLMQQVGQTLAASAVPKVGEAQAAAVARSLRVIGVWVCLPDAGFPQSCECVEALMKDHTTEWVQEALERHLTGLA